MSEHVAEMERLRAEIVAVHGEIDDLYERLYEAAHCGSARECQLMVLALLDKDGEKVSVNKGGTLLKWKS